MADTITTPDEHKCPRCEAKWLLQVITGAAFTVAEEAKIDLDSEGEPADALNAVIDATIDLAGVLGFSPDLDD